VSFVAIAFQADLPLVTQIEARLRAHLDQRTLNAGTRLPSVRHGNPHGSAAT
jgi:DNA-binding transcriptional regulator YhcF (GntR family)